MRSGDPGSDQDPTPVITTWKLFKSLEKALRERFGLWLITAQLKFQICWTQAEG
jgi:hypothetical protein